MNLLLKKSCITNWWVAEEKSKMTFVNILSEAQLNGTFVVVGYLNNKKLVFCRETVGAITKKGVITCDNTFYPFKDAHPVYLQFIVEANKPNCVIAKNWKYASNENKERIIADIVDKDIERKDVEFDFCPVVRSDVEISGYSKELQANIVIANFDQRDNYVSLALDFHISITATKTNQEHKENLKRVARTFKKTTSKKYIRVREYEN